MKIIELKRGDYQDHLLEYEYTTKYYYHVSIKKRNEIKMTIKKKRFLRKQVKKFQDHLFANYIENPMVYGILDRKKLVAVIEGSLETWNNRFRIWNFLVDKKYRGEGYGKALFDHMVELAKSLKRKSDYKVSEFTSEDITDVGIILDGVWKKKL